MGRAFPLLLAVLPAAAAWGLVGSAGFGTVFALGLGALAGGAWTLAAPAPRRLAVVAGAIGVTALPGAAGLRMYEVAGSIMPFGRGYIARDLAVLQLPVASEGDLDLRRPPRVVVNLDRYGVVWWQGRRLWLSELEEVLRVHAGPLLLRLDRDAPCLHLAWLLALARASAREEVHLAVEKHATGWITDEELAVLGAARGRGYWPELELVLPLSAPADGALLGVEGVDPKHARWGPEGTDIHVMKPSRARYQLGARRAADLAELADLLREAAPVSVEAGATVPVKFLVAALNEVRRAGWPPPAVSPVEPPADVREAEYLPFPG